MLSADLRHFLDLPDDATGPARRLATQLGHLVRAAAAAEPGPAWISAPSSPYMSSGCAISAMPATKATPSPDPDSDAASSFWGLLPVAHGPAEYVGHGVGHVLQDMCPGRAHISPKPVQDRPRSSSTAAAMSRVAAVGVAWSDPVAMRIVTQFLTTYQHLYSE